MSNAVRQICDRCGDVCGEHPLALCDLPAKEVRAGFVDLCEDCEARFFEWLNDDPEGVFDTNLNARGDAVDEDEDEDEDERVLHSEPLVAQRQIMPLSTPVTLFDSGQVITIEVRPQVRVALNRLIVPSSLAGKFIIEDISVVTDDGPRNTGAMAVELFSEVAMPSVFPGWADATHPVLMRVRHVPQQTEFQAVFMCERLPAIGEVEP